MNTTHISSAPSTVRLALQELTTFLRKHHCDAPTLVAQLCIMHALQVDKIFLITQGHMPIQLERWQQAYLWAQRYALGEPLAYIMGTKEFYGREFKVTKATLIPRPESEDVLEAIMHLARKKPQYTLPQEILTFADIGTGSGCLACTFAAEIPYAHGFMLDISAAALQVAQYNALHLEVQQRVHPLRASLYALPFAPHSLDVLISNPPYVSEAEFMGLEQNVREFEPKTALVPVPNTDKNDPHGLVHIEALAQQAWKVLRPNGLCVIEHGCTQGDAVRKLFLKYGTWKNISTGQDLAGLDRYCLCEKE